MSEAKQNPMRVPRVTKVTLNFGAGKNQELLARGIKLISQFTEVRPMKCLTNKRIASWGLRPGLPVGAKVTIRGQEAEKLLPRLLVAKDHTLKPSCFDKSGNVSFGILEYLDVEGAQYDASIGIIGFQVSVTVERPGYRVSRRREKKNTVSPKHRLTRDETVKFMSERFGIKVGDE